MAKEFNKESYMEFERAYFGCYTSPQPIWKLRFGQAVCSVFRMPKEIEDKIYYETDLKKVQVIIWSSFNDTVSRELTPEEIRRQDFVDGNIYLMLGRVLERLDPDASIEHNIEAISEIRDVIIKYYIDGKYDEMDFYPYLEE